MNKLGGLGTRTIVTFSYARNDTGQCHYDSDDRQRQVQLRKVSPQVTKWEDVALCEGISDGAINFVHQRMSIYLYTFHRNVYTLHTRFR